MSDGLVKGIIKIGDTILIDNPLGEKILIGAVSLVGVTLASTVAYATHKVLTNKSSAKNFNIAFGSAKKKDK